MNWILLAQNIPNSGIDLTTGSGWAGAGLIGLVLAWLLFVYLPRQEARSDAKEVNFFTRLTEKDKAHKEEIEELTKTHKAAIDLVVAHCREEMDKITSVFSEKVLAELRSIRNERQHNRG